ncbi:DsbA family protein [Streptomyces sp. NPDC005438]|uniref:DsbA family protein n=1 Tax=Streptomyces sp. NPDC005438 TaxID=3156880 RepID=UPI0033B90D9D
MPDSDRSSTTPRGRRRTVLGSTALVVAVTLAAFALTLDDGDGRDSGAREPAASGSPESADPTPPDKGLLALARRDASDPLAVGRADAPVVMIEYSDFQCPFCGRFARETKPELLRSYVKKGILRIEWRNFPVFGEESNRAAHAAWAAGQQGRFWEFHDVVYAEPRKRNAGEFGTAKLVAMARKAKVADLDRFRADLSSPRARKAVEKDQREGYGLGVTSTPAFLVNDRPLLGAQPTGVFTSAITAAAKAAEK